jgi:beta-glucanase (GH16 family)
MRILITLSFLLLAVSGISQINYELVWADEFDGNGAIDNNNWFHQTQIPAGGSWYNGEIQHYTNRELNANQSNGTLKIVAKKEVFTDQGYTKQYTSARLNSKTAFKYGRIEVKAKLPFGVGTWPAIWTLGKNIIEPGGYWTNTFGSVNWPACGEIDIMEHWGANQDFVQSALHTPSSFGGTVNIGGQNVNNASTEFHIYELEWTSEEMIFSVDGIVHYTYNPPIKNMDTWPFDADQYILLNVAILPDINPTTFTESTLEVDYVRVYQESILGTSDFANLNNVEFTNPVDETLHVKISGQLTQSLVQIYDVLGKQLYASKITHEDTTIDTSSFPKGIYLMKIESTDGIITKKILKK